MVSTQIYPAIAKDLSVSVGTAASIILTANQLSNNCLLIQNASATAYIGISIGTTVPTVNSSGVGGLGTYILGPREHLQFGSQGLPIFPGILINAIASGAATPLTILNW